MTLALIMFTLPREPDVGFGCPPALQQTDIERIHANVLDAADRVKSDVKSPNGAER